MTARRTQNAMLRKLGFKHNPQRMRRRWSLITKGSVCTIDCPKGSTSAWCMKAGEAWSPTPWVVVTFDEIVAHATAIRLTQM